MTTPSSPQEPQPGWQPPSQQPAYGDQPTYGNQPAYGNAPGYGNAPVPPAGQVGAGRPGQVTAAAVIGIVVGALGILGGLLSLGLVFDFSVLLGLLSLVSLAISIAALVGGIQVLRGGSPQVLLLAAYASIAVNLILIIADLASGYGFAFGSLLSFVLPILIVVFIRQNSAWFASRGIK